MLSGVCGGMANAAAKITVFNPTILGRTSATSPSSNYVVYMASSDFELAPGTAVATGTSAVWLIKTSTDCFIRVGGNTSPAGTEQWYNTGGTQQGDPGLQTGTGTNVFQLNQVPDTVNIYNKLDNNTLGTCSFTNTSGGTSYTSDDKSTFFNPTQDAKYGRMVVAAASCTGGFCNDVDDGYTQVQFTFRKSGLDDYTVTFTARGRGNATVEF